MSYKSIITGIVIVLALAACAPAANPQATNQPSAAPVQTQASTVQTQPPAEEPLAPALPDPAWFSIPLVNVRTGEGFTIADLKGKVILVETLAMWCSNCKKQQEQVKELHTLLGENPDFVSVGLDIDPNEVASDLKTYTDANDFTWTYVVAPSELTSEIGSLYGEQFLNPPSTPMLIIDALGEVHPLPFGIKSAADLAEFLKPYLPSGA